jgi:hypothetical protein
MGLHNSKDYSDSDNDDDIDDFSLSQSNGQKILAFDTQSETILQLNRAIDIQDTKTFETLIQYCKTNNIDITPTMEGYFRSPFSHFIIQAVNHNFSEETVRAFMDIFIGYDESYPIIEYKWAPYVFLDQNKYLHQSEVPYYYANENGAQTQNSKAVATFYKHYIRTRIPLFVLLQGIKLMASAKQRETMEVIIQMLFAPKN